MFLLGDLGLRPGVLHPEQEVTDDDARDRGPRFLPGTHDVVFASTRAGRYALFRTQNASVAPLSSPSLPPSSPCALVAPAPSDAGVVAAFELGCGKIAVGAHELPINALPLAWSNADTLLAVEPERALLSIDVATGKQHSAPLAIGALRVIDPDRAVALDGRRLVVLDLHDLSERPITDERDRPLVIDANVVDASIAVARSSSAHTLYVLTSRADTELWRAKLTTAAHD